MLINPFTDRTSWVDLRERFLEIPQQTAITKDNASISIDFIIFYKVVDPAMSVLKVQNFAEGARRSAILRAEGLSRALEQIRSVARDLDENTMQLQYLETLKEVGTSPSTKIVVPMEIGGLLSGLRGLLPTEPAAQAADAGPVPPSGGPDPATGIGIGASNGQLRAQR